MYGGLPGILISDADVGGVEYGIQSREYKKRGDIQMSRAAETEAVMLEAGIVGGILSAPELAIAAGLGFVGAHIAERSIRLKRQRQTISTDDRAHPRIMSAYLPDSRVYMN